MRYNSKAVQLNAGSLCLSKGRLFWEFWMTQANLTIVGLGPAGAELITREAWDWLNSQSEIWVRNTFHPAIQGLPEGLKVSSFELSDEDANEETAELSQLVKKLIGLAGRAKGVTYAVPGSPWVGDLSVSLLTRAAKKDGLSVRVIDGVSFLSVVSQALGEPVTTNWHIADANALANLEVPDYSASQPAIITNLTSRELASELKLTLMANYADEYPVKMVHGAGTNMEIVEPVALWQIDRSPHIGGLTSLYVPPLESGRSFEDLQGVVGRLRAPDGCVWDREQTHLSLRPFLIEEAYEVLQALDEGDPEHLVEELGDLLLQIVLHAQIGSEDGEFNMTDVLAGISQKLIRRHPHVFSSLELDSSDAVIKNWEEIKAAERKQRGEEEEKGMLDGIPLALPALTQAEQIQKRAQSVGFDWPEIAPVVAKIGEEIEELRIAESEAEKVAEAGDVLFAAVNWIRWLGIDPEFALRECNARFKRRFGYIEKHAISAGKALQDLSFEEMDALWEEAKHSKEVEGKKS